MRTVSHLAGRLYRTRMANERADLTTLAGRDLSERADTRRTRDKLVEALRQWVTMHGAPPQRLAEVAELAGVSNATAYRHFASLDDVIQAVVLELPVRAVELFETTNTGDDPLDAFRQWNRCWVEACLECGGLAVHLRSPAGFLQRRNEGDPVIGYACDQIEPLLAALAGDTTLMLFTWNLTSDPREVLDLHRLGWDVSRIAEFVTRSVLATPSAV